MTLTASDLSSIRQERQIFAGVDLSLQEGELLWVKGRNGAGKSSLLRIMARLLSSPTGKVLWQGDDVAEDPEPYLSNLQYIGHQDGLKTAFSPKENLQFWVDFHGRGDVSKALEAFELAPIADSPVRILSAGQKKRTHLARLVACPAPLWILDEPVSSLDVHFIDLFRHVLKTHLNNGGMALLATHQDLQMDGTRILDLDRIGGEAS
ncbi:heme ABC exporter ATP-binding protein CcmA [Sneathiella sp. P13V-1]|uniref:heme ABC exporter ATP-binding protein CcmA n=1 Tax=Sneathiella sp. P13V-1 TaxID=2697366 RepID=UPI00187B5B34|nr:heme ABC exporter ATP-binding protein CcmA [Sneathiella sp. P13V-1]MBE7636285.1 heme ABC exporter ATP-binding protein CcmA [Sneathiella sp. P13V-1]